MDPHLWVDSLGLRFALCHVWAIPVTLDHFGLPRPLLRGEFVCKHANVNFVLCLLRNGLRDSNNLSGWVKSPR